MGIRLDRRMIAALGFLVLVSSGGCAPGLARPYKAVECAITIPEAQAASDHVLDVTCVDAHRRTTRLGWMATTDNRITFRVDRVIKGDFQEPQVVLAWQETEWSDPRWSSLTIHWLREGRRFRLYGRGLWFGRLTGLKIAELDKARKWISSAIEVQVKRLRDERPEVRRDAAKTLGTYGADAHVAAAELERLFDDPEEDVRSAARQAVANLPAATTTP